MTHRFMLSDPIRSNISDGLFTDDKLAVCVLDWLTGCWLQMVTDGNQIFLTSSTPRPNTT